MRFAFTQGQLCAWRGFVTSTIISAFFVTIAISDAPRLHEQIHRVQGAEHTCAVTILSAGGIELCGSGVAAAAPGQAPELYAFTPAACARLVGLLDFLPLEHAPPVLS